MTILVLCVCVCGREAGIKQFSMEVRSVQQCVQLTCNYGTFYLFTHSTNRNLYHVRCF